MSGCIAEVEGVCFAGQESILALYLLRAYSAVPAHGDMIIVSPISDLVN